MVVGALMGRASRFETGQVKDARPSDQDMPEGARV